MAEIYLSILKWVPGHLSVWSCLPDLQVMISAPLIMVGPGAKQAGLITRAFSTLMDLAQTIYDLSRDMAGQKNLREDEPEKYRELLPEWETCRQEDKLQIPTPESM